MADSILLGIKEGLPEEREIVLCTVTKVYPTSVFANLDEYKQSGMIHISEISPGRIRNINDYVKVGKKIVCKVLKIDTQKGHIDLSLRRVTESQRREKANEIKQEQKAEKIVEFVAAKLKKEKVPFYEEIALVVFKIYPTLYSCFEEASTDKKVLGKIGIPKDLAKELQEVIEQRIQPPIINLKGVLTLKTYEPNGVADLQKSLIAAEKEGAEVVYLGGGNYSVAVTSDDIKEADQHLTRAVQIAITTMQKLKGEASFVRSDEK